MKELLTAKNLTIRILLGLLILVVVMIACSLIGTEKVSLTKVFAGPDSQGINIDYEIFVIRLRRVVLAGMVGAALACSGVVLQAILRNPLADPYILGISSGAGLGAIIAILSGISWAFWGGSNGPPGKGFPRRSVGWTSLGNGPPTAGWRASLPGRAGRDVR